MNSSDRHVNIINQLLLVTFYEFHNRHRLTILNISPKWVTRSTNIGRLDVATEYKYEHASVAVKQ